jgi:CO/xanthine dehydrogenase Mo-binding subunit
MKKRGIGFASAMQGVNYHFGADDTSEVRVEVSEFDDQVEFFTVGSDLGQSMEATLIMLLCQALGGLSPALVRWAEPNTATSPDAGGTGASRQTSVTGNALWAAGQTLRDRLWDVAAEIMGLPSESITLDVDVFRGPGAEAVTWKRVAAQARALGIELRATGKFTAPTTTPLDEQGQGYPVNQFGYATQVAEVEVDTDTGEVEVLWVKAFHDAGRIVNPIGAEGQVEGGVVMGLGYALTEAFLMEEGHLLNQGFTNYLLPTIRDAPASIESFFVDEPIPFGAIGTKGLAEITMVPTAPAILNAIHDAIGARITCLPATPERVLEAVRRSAGEEK